MKNSLVSTMHRSVRCREIRCAPLKVEPGLRNEIIYHWSPTIWANWTDFQISSWERHKVYLNIISMILSVLPICVNLFQRVVKHPALSTSRLCHFLCICTWILLANSPTFHPWVVDKQGNPWDTLRCDMTWGGPNGHDIGDSNMETCSLWHDRKPRV